MRKYIYIGLLLLLCSGRASAQFTLVSGTVTDTNGLAYSCGTLSASIINLNGQSLYLNGVQFSPQPGATKLGCPTDPSTSRTAGAYIVQLADNTQIKCGSGASIITCATQTQWLFTINTVGSPPPIGTGPQVCTGTFTISGTTQTVNLLTCPALSNAIPPSFPLLAPLQSIGATAPNYSFALGTGTGMYGTGDPFLAFDVGGTSVMRLASSGIAGAMVPGTDCFGFAANISVGVDTCMQRVSADVFAFGTGSVGDTSGSLRAASYQSAGTTFTASGCANSTLVGGSTAGTYVSVTAGACTVTVTMGSSATAPHGWVCDAHDITTVADANNVTLGSLVSTTQATLVEGTVAANDVIAFKCTGY